MIAQLPQPHQFDDIVHGRVRLSVLAFLSASRSAEFTLLKKTLQITDGNLAVHLRKLETAGYVGIKKDFVDRKPRSTIKITAKGRKALAEYLEHMRSLMETLG